MILRVAALVALSVLAAACGLVQPPVGNGPLVTVEWHGGMCPDGECRSVVVIEADGLVRQTVPDEREIRRVSGETIEVLRAAIGATDFDALMARPFKGDCPTAYDGSEVIYEVTTASGVRRIASCEVEVDPRAPLFVAIEAVIGTRS